MLSLPRVGPTRRQLLRAIGVGALALPFIASPSDRPPSGAGAATSVQFYSPRFDPSLVGTALTRTVASYQQAHPETRIIPVGEVVPTDATLTLTRLAAARQLPDLVAYVDLPNLVQAGLIRAVPSDFRAANGLPYSNDLSKPLQDAVTIGGGRFGLPFEIGTRSALVYDRAQLAAAGIDPSVAPRHWDEFVDVAQRTTHLPDRHGFALIAQPGLLETYPRWYAWFVTAGGSQFDPARRQIALGDGTAALDVLSLYANLSVGVKVTLPNSTELDGAAAVEALGTGRVAMIQEGSQGLAQLRSDHPDAAGRLGFAALPWKAEDVAFLEPASIAAGSQSVKVDLAWDFARVFVSTDNLIQLFQTAGILPAATSAQAVARRIADPAQRFFLDRIAGPSVFVPSDPRNLAIVQRGGLMVHDVICGCVKPPVALRQALHDLTQNRALV
jgi:ABC-type glycerol-3-phosphate transport system substrate-binding protein